MVDTPIISFWSTLTVFILITCYHSSNFMIKDGSNNIKLFDMEKTDLVVGYTQVCAGGQQDVTHLHKLLTDMQNTGNSSSDIATLPDNLVIAEDGDRELPVADDADPANEVVYAVQNVTNQLAPQLTTELQSLMANLEQPTKIHCVDYDYWGTWEPDSFIGLWSVFSLIVYILICTHLLVVLVIALFPSSSIVQKGLNREEMLNKILSAVPWVIILMTILTIVYSFLLAYDDLAQDDLKHNQINAHNDDREKVNSMFMAGVTEGSKDGFSIIGVLAIIAYLIEMFAAFETFYLFRNGKEWMLFKGEGDSMKASSSEITSGKDTFALEDVKTDNSSEQKVKVISAFAKKRTLNGMRF